MKNLVIVAFCVTLFSCNETKDKAAEAPKNIDVLALNLKGKVKMIEETTTTIDSMGVSKMDSLTRVTAFDSVGYETESYTKDPSGNKVSEQMMKRNADGSFAEYSTFKDGKLMTKLVTEMKDGKYTGGKSYDSTEKQDGYYTELVNNDYGQVIGGKQHFMDGRVKATFASKYEGPLFIGGSGTDSTGKTDYTSTVVLDDKGNPKSETSMYTEKGVAKTEMFTYSYEYDTAGNWIVRTTINEKGKPTKITKRVITYF